ncbi:MAG: TraB/GumN family protein [Bacteroidia bacterium]
MKKILIISLLKLCTCFVAFGQEGLLWEITGKGLKKNSYLLGTYHLMPGSYVEEIYMADKLLQKSKTIVVETLIDSSLLPSLSLYMVDPEGGSWTNQLSRTELQQLDSCLRALSGMGLDVFGVLKPAAISTSIAMLLSKMATDSMFSAYSGPPMDLQIAQGAKASNKQAVVGLESMADQFELLYNHEPIDTQLAQLRSMMLDIDSLIPWAQALALAYMQQDEAAMMALLAKHQGSMGSTEALLDARNKRWMEQLPALMKSKPCFIAVGALHLYGEAGLIAELRKAGYKVKAVSKKSTQLSLLESGMDIVMWTALIVVFLAAGKSSIPAKSTDSKA